MEIIKETPLDDGNVELEIEFEDGEFEEYMKLAKDFNCSSISELVTKGIYNYLQKIDINKQNYQKVIDNYLQMSYTITKEGDKVFSQDKIEELHNLIENWIFHIGTLKEHINTELSRIMLNFKTLDEILTEPVKNEYNDVEYEHCIGRDDKIKGR